MINSRHLGWGLHTNFVSYSNVFCWPWIYDLFKRVLLTMDIWPIQTGFVDHGYMTYSNGFCWRWIHEELELPSCIRVMINHEANQQTGMRSVSQVSCQGISWEVLLIWTCPCAKQRLKRCLNLGNAWKMDDQRHFFLSFCDLSHTTYQKRRQVTSCEKPCSSWMVKSWWHGCHNSSPATHSQPMVHFSAN